MVSTGGTAALVPAFRMEVNGTALPADAAAELIEVTVHQELGVPAMCTVRLVNWDMNQLMVTWSDASLFDLGGVVTIQLGYVDNLSTVFSGEITGLEPEFCANEVPQVVVRAYDRGHRLLRGRKTRSYLKVKDSDIASQVASEAGLTGQTDDTGIELEYVLQHNQTDLEFLQARAAPIGYEVVVDDKTLHFRKHQTQTQAVFTLSRDDDLLEFYPRLSTLTQVNTVKVQGWSPKEKASVVGQATVSAVTTTMNGNTSGPAAANSAFGQAPAAIVDRPVFSQGEAAGIAAAQVNEVALGYVSGDGVCMGTTLLKAGVIIDLLGLGDRFSGSYYVASATHTYSPRRGYRTAFTVRRTAT